MQNAHRVLTLYGNYTIIIINAQWKIEKYYWENRKVFSEKTRAVRGVFIDFKGVWICPFFVN